MPDFALTAGVLPTNAPQDEAAAVWLWDLPSGDAIFLQRFLHALKSPQSPSNRTTDSVSALSAAFARPDFLANYSEPLRAMPQLMQRLTLVFKMDWFCPSRTILLAPAPAAVELSRGDALRPFLLRPYSALSFSLHLSFEDAPDAPCLRARGLWHCMHLTAFCVLNAPD
jgi:hypothetical protein